MAQKNPSSSSPRRRRHEAETTPVPDSVDFTPPTPGMLWKDAFGRAAVRALQFLLLAGAVALVGWLAVTLKLVTLPLLIALIIACAMNPIISVLRRARFNRLGAALTALLGIVLVLAGVIFLIVMTVINEWSDLASQAQQGVNQLIEMLKDWGVPLDDSHLTEYLETANKYLSEGGAGSSAVEGFSYVTELVAGALLMVVMLFFFLLDGPHMWAFLVGFFPQRTQHRVDDAGRASVFVLGRYIRGTVIIAAFAAIMDLIAMLVMHIPLAFPLAAMIFMGAFIPIVGALTTGLAAALIALVAAGPTAAVVLVCVVILVNQIEHHILQPKVMGTALSLHGVVVISALAIGAHEGGVAGALLAVPLTAVAWASFKAIRKARGLEPGLDREQQEAEERKASAETGAGQQRSPRASGSR